MLIKDYKEKGFYIEKKLFSKTEIEEIKTSVFDLFKIQIDRFEEYPTTIKDLENLDEKIINLYKEHQDSFLGCAKSCQNLIALHKYSVSKKLLLKLNKLGLTTPVMCTIPLLMFQSSYLDNRFKTPLHQDWRSMQGSLDSVAVWVPLIDVNKDLGALDIIVGSHKRGLLETKQDSWFRRIEDDIDENEIKCVDMKAGDAMFFSTFLIHRSGENITDQIRWTMQFRFNNINESTYIERNFPYPYIIQPEQKLITSDFPTQDNIKHIFR